MMSLIFFERLRNDFSKKPAGDSCQFIVARDDAVLTL